MTCVQRTEDSRLAWNRQQHETSIPEPETDRPNASIRSYLGNWVVQPLPTCIFVRQEEAPTDCAPVIVPPHRKSPNACRRGYWDLSRPQECRAHRGAKAEARKLQYESRLAAARAPPNPPPGETRWQPDAHPMRTRTAPGTAGSNFAPARSAAPVTLRSRFVRHHAHGQNAACHLVFQNLASRYSTPPAP
jgi:hypothetical protein